MAATGNSKYMYPSNELFTKIERTNFLLIFPSVDSIVNLQKLLKGLLVGLKTARLAKVRSMERFERSLQHKLKIQKLRVKRLIDSKQTKGLHQLYNRKKQGCNKRPARTKLNLDSQLTFLITKEPFSLLNVFFACEEGREKGRTFAIRSFQFAQKSAETCLSTLEAIQTFRVRVRNRLFKKHPPKEQLNSFQLLLMPHKPNVE